jgi:hypothetical protein
MYIYAKNCSGENKHDEEPVVPLHPKPERQIPAQRTIIITYTNLSDGKGQYFASAVLAR